MPNRQKINFSLVTPSCPPKWKPSLDGVLVVDDKDVSLSFNQLFVEIWQLPDEILQTKSEKAAIEFILSQLVDPADFLQKLESLYSSRQEKSRDNIHLKDERLLDRYSTPLIGPEGTCFGRIWYFRDITEQTRMELELFKGLTQQLFTFSKGGEPVKQVVSLEEVIRESADLVLSGTNVRCEWDFAKDLRQAEVDTGQIGQAIQNIVLNASQAMPEGGIVTISCRNIQAAQEPEVPLACGDYLKLEIADSGDGIPAEPNEKLSTPITRQKRPEVAWGSQLPIPLSACIMAISALHRHLKRARPSALSTRLCRYKA